MLHTRYQSDLPSLMVVSHKKVPFKGNTRKKDPCKEPIMQIILSFFPLIFYVHYLKIKDR